MNISIKGFITCKGAELYADCADYYNSDLNTHRFCVSDGVSKSFFPKIWSKALSENFVKDNTEDKLQFIKDAQKHWQSHIEEIVAKPEVKWFTKAEYNRRVPALATFVGLELEKEDLTWRAWALGDSFLFFVPQGYKDFEKEVEKLSSKKEPIIFDNFPDYFSSIGGNHKGELQIIEGKLEEGTFYLMTDALAEWFISGKGKAIDIVNSWKDQREFEDYVSAERKNGHLTDDDSAILTIKLESTPTGVLVYSTTEITSLEELIQKQESEVKANKSLELPKEENVLSAEAESREEFKKELLISNSEKIITNTSDPLELIQEQVVQTTEQETNEFLEIKQENNTQGFEIAQQEKGPRPEEDFDAEKEPEKKEYAKSTSSGHSLWKFLFKTKENKDSKNELKNPQSENNKEEVETINSEAEQVTDFKSREEQNNSAKKDNANAESLENIPDVEKKDNTVNSETEKNEESVEREIKEELKIQDELVSSKIQEKTLSENSKLNEAANKITNKF